jgi:hypothetical protein
MAKRLLAGGSSIGRADRTSRRPYGANIAHTGLIVALKAVFPISPGHGGTTPTHSEPLTGN